MSCSSQRRRCWGNARALSDQVLAVVEQERDLALGTRREPGCGKRVDVPTDRGTRYRVGVQWIGLAELRAPTCARAGHQLGRHAHHPLAGAHQEALEATGYVATVLDRPHALDVQCSSPGQQPFVWPSSRALTVSPSTCVADSSHRAPPRCGSACVGPCRSRSCVPSLRLSDHLRSGLPVDMPQSGREPSSYQVTPAILGRQWATQRMSVSPNWDDSEPKSQPTANPGTYRLGRTSPPTLRPTMTVASA